MSDFGPQCPACESPDSQVLGEKNSFAMHSCRRCGTLRAVGDYSDGASLYEGIYAKPPELSPGTRAGLRRILEKVEPARRSGRMLDYGFGAADLMREAREMGWKVSGIEYSDNARRRAEADGFEVFKSATSLGKGDYDVVTMIEVIEHVPDSGLAFREALEALRPGGSLYITTPNARGLNARLLGLNWSVVGPPDHRVLFSRAGLAACARRAGFHLSSLRTEGLSPSEWKIGRAPEKGGAAGCAPAAALNDTLETRPALRAMKRIANQVLSPLGLGDTIKLLARRP